MIINILGKTEYMDPFLAYCPTAGLPLMHPNDQLACLMGMVQREIITKEQFLQAADYILAKGGFSRDASPFEKDEGVRGKINSQLLDMKVISRDDLMKRLHYREFERHREFERQAKNA